jgi:poly-gamma-glutamate synthesis protein (capsule biosynthesis protein)
MMMMPMASALRAAMSIARETEAADGGERRQRTKIFLSGDVMTGRGVDQVLPHPSDPRLHEWYVQSALDYVRLAEEANGPIPAPVDFAYVWGDALIAFERRRPDLRLINLETAITRSEAFEPKGINYRMSPDNLPCLTAASVDVCALANNHVLDWGRAGLADTLDLLRRAGIKTAGAGPTIDDARAPAIIRIGDRGRALIFAAAMENCGVPPGWAASVERSGVWWFKEMSSAAIDSIRAQARAFKQPGDIAILSLHWGENWGYEIAEREIDFAHALVDQAGIDIVHGHSSHHPKAIEIYKGRPIFYGCGDLLNDYEGIHGHEEFRGDLSLMYFATMDHEKSQLAELTLAPMQIKNFKLNDAPEADAAWLRHTLNRECARFNVSFSSNPDGSLGLTGLIDASEER